MSRVLPPLLLAALAVSGCMPDRGGGVGRPSADAATQAACRQRAEETYTQQNRADIYRPPPPVNTPFSAEYTPGVTDRGLSELFAHDKMISDCVRNTGTGAERSVAPPSGPPPPLPPRR